MSPGRPTACVPPDGGAVRIPITEKNFLLRYAAVAQRETWESAIPVRRADQHCKRTAYSVEQAPPGVRGASSGATASARSDEEAAGEERSAHPALRGCRETRALAERARRHCGTAQRVPERAPKTRPHARGVIKTMESKMEILLWLPNMMESRMSFFWMLCSSLCCRR